MSQSLSIEDFNHSDKSIQTWARAILAIIPHWDDPVKFVAAEILNSPKYRKSIIKENKIVI